MPSFMDRVKLSYNVLRNKGPTVGPTQMVMSASPSSVYSGLTYSTEASVLAPIKTRIAMDAANIPMRHVLVDERKQYLEDRQSELNDRLTIMANVDQTGIAFIQDAVMTLLEEGACVLVPIEISRSPNSSSYDILSMRVGRVVDWMNYSLRIEVYNELTGEREEKILPKSFMAVCYNPLYAVMNEPNGTLRRLVQKLALLDQADGRLYSPQLDLILQLPFTTKTSRKQTEADRRLESLENQLYESKYGIGYIDPTEKVTQLNRPVTNTLADTVDGLVSSLHSQLGLTPSIFAGTATQEEMLLYYNRTILPVLRALTDAMVGAFFSRTAIRQGNDIQVFPSLFKMAPLETFAEAADKFTRNAIMSSNEIRAVVGMPPHSDPDADALRNKNLNQSDNVATEETKTPSDNEENKE
jgi:hypothetical protein